MNIKTFLSTGFLILLLAAILVGAQPQSSSHPTKGTPPPQAAAAQDLLPFKPTQKTLPNGLKVIVVPTGFPNLVSLQIPVQTGSRNEVEPGKSGFAHFFEHMMFRGTKQYSPEEYNKIIVKAGARQNAYTTDDYTNYHITFAKEDLETILKIEADRFQKLSYSEEAFRTESRAVLGEYNKNSAEPVAKLQEVQHEHAFKVHTYQHTTMGFLKDIEDMPNQFAYSRQFFDRWYRPEYTTVIVAGDVDSEKVLPLIEKYWGGWQRGTFKVNIPQEPEPKGPVYAHVPWKTQTLPWVTVAFHAPAFSTTAKDFAAVDMLMDLYFGPTSVLYKRLVEQEQKVDLLMPDYGTNADPNLATIFARIKKTDDALYVRDEILKTVAQAHSSLLPKQRVDDAKSNARYSLLRRLDNTERIAGLLARFVRFDRSYGTLNQLYRIASTLTPRDLQAAAVKYFTDNRLVVTTLSASPLPAGIETAPSISNLTEKNTPAKTEVAWISQKTLLPQVTIKLLFAAGSAADPKGKEGLAALTAAMITEGGSKDKPIDEIKKGLFPIAGSVDSQADKEMTTLTLSIHRDNWLPMAELVMPMVFDPGFREEDFKRLKDAQLNALKVDLRSNNEEELGKERLQTNLFSGTPYGHPVLGSVAGIESITLEDVKEFYTRNYTQAHLTVGISGNFSLEMETRIKQEVGRLPAGSIDSTREPFKGNKPQGYEVEIIEKETRSTAISLGHPIPVTRSHPDFAALMVGRTWLGEHRASSGRLYQRLREIRGLNYGDYAYIEAFPRGMFQFFPDANIARRSQLFEIWIRPVLPENAHHALRIALFELKQLIDRGLSQEDFEAARNYLMKNVYLLTSTQDSQLGYALDSRWYNIGEYSSYMRTQLQKLTREEVNRALKQYLSASNLSIVLITQDAAGLKKQLLEDQVSSIKYEAPRPKEIMDEDVIIGRMKLEIKPEKFRITPVDEVFSK
jgi:zinc protease